MQAEPWIEFWDHLHLRYVQFSGVGLSPDSPDDVVWQTCQDHDLILVTDNRNRDGPDSQENYSNVFPRPQAAFPRNSATLVLSFNSSRR